MPTTGPRRLSAGWARDRARGGRAAAQSRSRPGLASVARSTRHDAGRLEEIEAWIDASSGNHRRETRGATATRTGGAARSSSRDELSTRNYVRKKICWRPRNVGSPAWPTRVPAPGRAAVCGAAVALIGDGAPMHAQHRVTTKGRDAKRLVPPLSFATRVRPAQPVADVAPREEDRKESALDRRGEMMKRKSRTT